MKKSFTYKTVLSAVSNFIKPRHFNAGIERILRLSVLFCGMLLINIGMQAQTISSFSPLKGPIGTLVTINGTGLGSTTGVTIGGANAILVSKSGINVVAMVMTGAKTGVISVANSTGTCSSSNSFAITTSSPPAFQQGDKFTGDGILETHNMAWFGNAVAISADGNTTVVGGERDNGQTGAVWVFTRSKNGIWTQQGPKLVGSGGNGFRQYQGISVAISADGNTIIEAGTYDNDFTGAVWVFTRNSSGVWTQQGSKLVAKGIVRVPLECFGQSISLSADGNIALIGQGNYDNQVGATWVFARDNNGVWSQQAKLVGSDNVVNTWALAISVSLSADGNTAIVGGWNDDSQKGAAWIFVRNGNVWKQQGEKLRGSKSDDQSGGARQGSAVAISADGNTVMIGGISDKGGEGAAWVFTRSGEVWLQQGDKLKGTGADGPANQGNSVSLSADGNIAVIGGSGDSSTRGAFWEFTRNNKSEWNQYGAKLFRGGYTKFRYQTKQASSLAISTDGSTIIDGAPGYEKERGTCWIFTNNLVGLVDTEKVCASDLPYRWNGNSYDSSGIYTIYFKAHTGGDSVATLVLTVLSNGFKATLIANDTILCFRDGYAALHANAKFGAEPYLYSINNKPNYQTSNSFKELTGTFAVTVKDNNGCAITTNSVVIKHSPSPLGISTKQYLNCTTGEGIITATATGGYGKYLYSMSYSENYQSSNVFRVSKPGIYYIYVFDNGVCKRTAEAHVIPMVGEFLTSRTSVCYGDSTDASVWMWWGSGTTPYQFSLDGIKYQSSNAFRLAAGYYTATVKDSAGCLYTTNALSITQPAAPLTTSFNIQKVSCLGGNNGSITVIASGGYSTAYTYRINNNAFQSSNIFTGLIADTFKVKTRDANNCAVTKTVIVKQLKTPCFAEGSSIVDGLSKSGSGGIELKVSVTPNPAITGFSLTIQGGETNKAVDIRVVDMLGKVMYQAHGSTFDTYRFGNDFAGGVYIAEVINGNSGQRVKLVKGR